MNLCGKKEESNLMNLFGKKKEDPSFAEASEDEESLELEDRRLTRKFRDLRPENKRKRKEPPKLWGKRERIIVAAFFIVTTLSATLMFLFSHEFKLPGLPKITFKGINFENPFGEKVIELGQKKSARSDDSKAEQAIEMFDKEVGSLSGVYGFLVIRLNSGDSYGVSTNSRFQGASILKLPLMILAYRMDEEGSIDLETKYVLKNEDKVAGSGVMYAAKAGTEYSYRELIKHMGKESDRTAYKVMKDVIGEEKLRNFLNEIGATNTDINTGFTTPGDIGIILQKIWNRELMNEENTIELLGFLTDTIYEDWITAGVPDGIKVAHKFGTDSGILADGGIVFAHNPYILVIMGQEVTKSEADKVIPKISRNIYAIETGSE